MEEDNLDWILCRFCRIPFKGKHLLALHKKTEHSNLVQIKQKRKPIQKEEEITQMMENSRKRKMEEEIPSVKSTSTSMPIPIPTSIPMVSNSTTSLPIATNLITTTNRSSSTVQQVAQSHCPVTMTDTEKYTQAILSNNKPQQSIENVLNSYKAQILNRGKINSSHQHETEQETFAPLLPSPSIQACVNSNKNYKDDNQDDETEIIRMKKLVNSEEEEEEERIEKTKVPESHDNEHVNKNTIEVTYHVQSIKQEEEVEVLDGNHVKLELESELDLESEQEQEKDPICCSSSSVGSSNNNDFGLDVQMEKYFQCEDCYQNFLTIDNFNLHKRLKCGKQPEPDTSSRSNNNNNNIDGGLRLIQTVDKDNNKILKLIKIQLVEQNLAFSRFKIIQTNFKIRDTNNLIPINNNNANTNNINNNNDNNNIIVIHNNDEKDEAPDTNFVINPITPVPNNNNDSNNEYELSISEVSPSEPIPENNDDDDNNNIDSKPYPKVPLSFTSLTALAIRAQGNLGVHDIYKFIMDEFPYYSTIPKGNWRNSVRHTVATCQYFQRVTKDLLQDGIRRRALWQLDPQHNKLLALESRIRRECIKNQAQILKAMKNPHKFETMVP